MANIATTVFKVMGTCDAVTNLYEAMKSLQKEKSNIWLGDLANHYGIDYQTRCISVRGNIFTFDYEEDPEVDYYLLSFETESAWDAPFKVIEAISKVLNDELEINYRVFEGGCGLYYVHQESAIDFFQKSVASVLMETHLRSLVRMCISLSRMQLWNGAQRPATQEAK